MSRIYVKNFLVDVGGFSGLIQVGVLLLKISGLIRS
jgi:hypothetical protein